MIGTKRGWAAIAGAAVAGLVYAIGIEPYAIVTERVELLCPRLPAALDGYTIMQVSDLHTRNMGRRERLIARIIESLPNPDLIAVTGDLVHTTAGIEPFLEIARSMRARDGVFAVFGNSEHKNGVDPAALETILDRAGITPLTNRNLKIERDDYNFRLAGVNDPASEHDDLTTALDGVGADEFTILLMHSPDPVAAAAVRGVDVVLSGHTHGGQIRLPVVGPLHTHSWHGLRMSSGHYYGRKLRKITGMKSGRTNLYVSRGLGVSGLAMRFLCRPELTILTLRAFK